MSWLSDLFSSGASKVVDSISSGLDSLFTSDEERLQAKLLIEKEVNAYKESLLKAQAKYDKEITERWKSDNEHAVTRLVRPLIVLWGFALLTIVMLLDGNVGGFTINVAYIPLLETIVTTSVVAYMGARTIDKFGKK